MKNTIILMTLVLGLMACSKNRVTITGSFSNADTLTLFLEEVDVYETRKLDSVKLDAGGDFRFNMHITAPGFYQLRLSTNQNIVLFPEPGDQISIQADRSNILSSLNIEGSPDTEQVQTLAQGLSRTKFRLDSIGSLFTAADSDTAKERLNQEYQDMLESHRKTSIAFILTHYNSLASLYALYQQYQPGTYVFYRNTDIQFFRIVSDSLQKYYPDARHVLALEAFTNRLIANYNSSLITRMAENSEPVIPEIALPGLTGDTLRINELEARYVLLNFWASWSPESVEMNQALMNIYNAYQNRDFEIFAVSLDNSTDSWTRAIKYDELYWINVIDEKFPNSLAAATYNVNALPCVYLLDMTEKSILAKNLTPAQLRERLSDLLD